MQQEENGTDGIDISPRDKQTDRKLERMKELRSKVEELKYLREKLQREISYNSYKASVSFSTLLLNEEPVASCALPPPEQNELVEKAHALVKIRRLESKMAAYRYGGITVQKIDQQDMIIAFGASYKGEYFETYYLQLKLDQDNTLPSSSTLPDFVPLTDLLDCLNKQKISLSNLLETVHCYLLAYVGRREQANEVVNNLSHLLSDTLPLQYPYTYLEIPLRLPMSAEQVDATIQLTYEHLHSALPSKVQCSESLSISEGAVEDLFLSQPLPDAMLAVEKLARTN